MKLYLPEPKELVIDSEKLSESSKSSIKFCISMSVRCFLLTAISEFPKVTAFPQLPEKFVRDFHILTN